MIGWLRAFRRDYCASDPAGVKAGFMRAHESRKQRSIRIGYAPLSCSSQPSQRRAGAPAGSLVPDPMKLLGMLIQGIFGKLGSLQAVCESLLSRPVFHSQEEGPSGLRGGSVQGATLERALPEVADRKSGGETERHSKRERISPGRICALASRGKPEKMEFPVKSHEQGT